MNKARMATLKRENILYEVTCGIEGCTCDRKDSNCKRGFFSLFIQAIYGIDFANRMKIPFHINFGGNFTYAYSDPCMPGNNFWNYYFHQPYPIPDPRHIPVINRFHELYPLRIWARSHFRKIHHNVIRHLKLKEPVELAIEKATEQVRNKRTLGIQIRRTDHFKEVPPISMDRFFHAIDKRIHRFDKLFLATDDNAIAETLRIRYGEKLITNNVIRSHNEVAIHFNDATEDRYQLGIDVLADCYCLSRCSEAILIHSNISYAALLLNPELPYCLLEKQKSWQKRWKTKTLYFLDKWKIRKW